jgi:SNF2 family DNA or RNA helicase
MEIVDNKALKLYLRHPDRVTSVIPKSKVVGTHDGLHIVLVHWGYDECAVLKNIGIKNIPSPILRDYPWHGLYKPFAHQRETAAFLTMHKRAYCFNEMGSGKTCSVLWAADYLMTKGAVKRMLIVCPLSIMSSAWRADAFKSVMHRRVDVAYGSRAKRAEIIAGGAEIVVINFDGVEIIANEIESGGFDLIVIDEFNAYKNTQTKRWKVMNRLLKPHVAMWGLTGSPASQSPTDAYGLAKLMNPKSVPNFYGAFRDSVMYKLTQYKYIPRPGASDYVYKVLQPAIRFTKEECLDLPPRVYVTREVPMTAQQSKYYKLLKDEMLFQAAGEEVSAVNAAVNLGKLLQIASGAVYSDTKEVVEFDCSGRLKAVEEIIEESSKKVIIFAVFKHNIQLLQTHLTKAGYTVDVIHGKIPPAGRTEIFDKFQTTPDPRVLVIQPKSASHGVTLTAANTIVWWNPTTSYETYIQANDRIHRAGQDAPCTVVHLTGSPVEERFYKALEHKGKMLDSIMELYKEVLDS